MNAARFAEQFPLGSHLCREPMPAMSEMKRDMALLKKQGFNLIKLQEHWMIDEPEEGRYDFSRYEELIDHAATLDMGIYLGLTCEQAPGWLYEKHPDCRMVGRDGLPIAYEAQMTLPADGKPGPCCDHEGAMGDQERFIRALVEKLGRFENVVIWNTWQEIGYWSEALTGQHVCYCPSTLAFFRRWLKAELGDLDELNRRWNTRYADWKYVTPNRCARIGCHPQEFWFRYFMDNIQIGRVLHRRAEVIRASDSRNRPVFAHVGGPSYGSGRDFTYAHSQDFLGCSCYPGALCWGPKREWDDRQPDPETGYERHGALEEEVWSMVAYRYDYLRGMNDPDKPIWAAEFQGGPVSIGFHKGRVPSPADMRRWVLTAVGSGITALSFWVTRAEIAADEINGFSLLDSEGDDTPRLDEAGRVGRALQHHADLFANPTRPQSRLAILVDEWNSQLCNSIVDVAPHLAYSVRGWYRHLWTLGVPVDIIDSRHLDEAFVHDYQAIIFPFPLSVADDLAEKLVAYAKGGGNLILEAAPGRIDDCGRAARGELSPRLRALLGVKQDSFTMVREPAGAQRWSPTERAWGEYLAPTLLKGCGPLTGASLQANIYLQTFVPEVAADTPQPEPVLTAGERIAAVRRQTGDGWAWAIGSYVGHSGTAYCSADSQRVVELLLQACGVVAERVGSLLLRRRVIAGKEAWILTNPGPDAVTQTIDASEWQTVGDLLDDDLQRSGQSVTLTVESLDVRVLILEA